MSTMTTPATSPATAPTIEELVAVDAGAGDHYFFLNHVATVKVRAGESTSGMNLVEFTAPKGFGPPLHVHRDEDEILYLLDGEIGLELGDTEVTVTAGAVVTLPHGIPHIFQVVSDEARFLTITSGGAGHPTFDRFVDALGTPVDPGALPDPVEIDPGHLAQVCADYGIEVLGPPIALRG